MYWEHISNTCVWFPNWVFFHKGMIYYFIFSNIHIVRMGTWDLFPQVKCCCWVLAWNIKCLHPKGQVHSQLLWLMSGRASGNGLENKTAPKIQHGFVCELMWLTHYTVWGLYNGQNEGRIFKCPSHIWNSLMYTILRWYFAVGLACFGLTNGCIIFILLVLFLILIVCLL